MNRVVVIVCPEHGEECHAHYLPAEPGEPSFEFNGVEVRWASHMGAEVHSEHRLNLDDPKAEDRRGDKPTTIQWSLACEDCTVALHGDEAERWRVAEHAGARGLLTAEEVGQARKLAEERAAHLVHAVERQLRQELSE